MQNRQIHEPLRTVVSAYKNLGGTCTDELSVHPAHLRTLQGSNNNDASPFQPSEIRSETASLLEITTTEKSRLTRDAGEAATSDVILLG